MPGTIHSLHHLSTQGLSSTLSTADFPRPRCGAPEMHDTHASIRAIPFGARIAAGVRTRGRGAAGGPNARMRKGGGKSEDRAKENSRTHDEPFAGCGFLLMSSCGIDAGASAAFCRPAHAVVHTQSPCRQTHFARQRGIRPPDRGIAGALSPRYGSLGPLGQGLKAPSSSSVPGVRLRERVRGRSCRR
jgi:hypothetical protein